MENRAFGHLQKKMAKEEWEYVNLEQTSCEKLNWMAFTLGMLIGDMQADSS
jgi:hypothetical protein